MKTRNKSIIQPKMDRCYFCGKKGVLHTHEVFFGTANRKKSIEYGLYVKLCPEHHNMGNKCVHNNKLMDLELKKAGQKVFEEMYSHEKFMSIFHKNYLDQR